MRQPCTAITKGGQPCKARAIPGKTWCRWHSPSPEDVAKHLDESRRGGEARNRTVALEPLSATFDVSAINLESAAGVRALLAASLRHLTDLPYTTTVANALSQTVLAQKTVIETSDLEERLEALEAQQSPGLRRA